LADATIGADQSVEVHRLVATVDCGRIVNPQLVRQQIEGGLIYALGLASFRAPDWTAGMPRSRPLGAIGLPKIARTPDIRVQLIASNEPPGGVSGLGVVALAPAVANAIYAATGKRLRSLPFDAIGSA
jgi:isoquinoline 1-oxidoreductase beta subunit